MLLLLMMMMMVAIPEDGSHIMVLLISECSFGAFVHLLGCHPKQIYGLGLGGFRVWVEAGEVAFRVQDFALLWVANVNRTPIGVDSVTDTQSDPDYNPERLAVTSLLLRRLLLPLVVPRSGSYY